jgi:hypothetical protein
MPPALRRFAEFLAANPSPAEVVMGQLYWVPCATLEGKRWRHEYGIRQKHIPLLGTVHQDKDIGFHPWHIHVDTRFLTITPSLHPVTRIRDDQRILGAPLCLGESIPCDGDTDYLIPSSWINSVLSLRKLIARRTPAEWPERRFQRKLENAYADTSAACGICPHRQIPLSAGRDIGHGVRQCPGHGLCWDREGCMVREGVTP